MMPVPLWATMVGISLAKKVTVLIAAKLYGIPRLYMYVFLISFVNSAALTAFVLTPAGP